MKAKLFVLFVLVAFAVPLLAGNASDPIIRKIVTPAGEWKVGANCVAIEYAELTLPHSSDVLAPPIRGFKVTYGFSPTVTFIPLEQVWMIEGDDLTRPH